MTAMIWSPFASENEASLVARKLLEEKLVGCANIVPGVRSMFDWEGEIYEEGEVGVLFKTDKSLLDQAVARIEELHPYETPAIVGWQSDAAGVATGNWLGQLAGSKSGTSNKT